MFLEYIQQFNYLVFVSAEASQSNSVRHRPTCRHSWSELILMHRFWPSVGVNTDSRVSVFVHDCFPGSRSALWDGGQATRWRPDSAVWAQNGRCSVASPHVASRRVKTSCLVTTKLFMAQPYLLHLHRKHPLCAHKTLFKVLFLRNITIGYF